LNVDIEVESGTLRGSVEGDVQVFRGVPFAAPPIGLRRFAPPGAVEQWSGVKEAKSFSEPSLQSFLEMVDGRAVVSETRVAGSEDCLYLNIYAPLAPGKYPVLVWIHGGGGVMGSPNDVDGTSYALDGVVFVSIAYRLGALGLLHLPGVFDESIGGNFAVLDQIAALKWVNHNIGAFGGDASRITIGGQSNGARCVGNLISAPTSNGLFSQAIMMSATGAGFLMSTEDEAKLVTEAVLRELNLESTDARRLRDIPGNDFVIAQSRMLRSWPTILPFQAVIDGLVITERPIETIRRGAAKGIKMLIGTTHDEFESFSLDNGGLGTFKSMMIDLETLETALAAYRADLAPDFSEVEIYNQTLTSSDWWIPAIRVAEAHQSSGGKSWMYRLDWRLSPRGQGLGAPHGLDIAIMANPDAPPNVLTPSEDDAPRFASVVEKLRGALIEFVIEGNLSSWNWPEYDDSVRSTFLFDDVSGVTADPDGQLRVIWQNLL
jgi:para-nitrobenzyl esterase